MSLLKASTKYIGRFAPSPTGPLHFGSLVAAVASYLDARAHGGSWLLRMEDVDATRCRAPFADEILDTISAFGMAWDGEVVYQSGRTRQYQEALDQLDAHHLTYPCACSRSEIADSALAGIDGPVYPGTCRARRLTAPGNAIRLLTSSDEICFIDRVQGKCCQQLDRDVGDFILRRRDGLFAYQLAVVVDDAAQGITDVVRGADLLDSTARQIHLQRRLELPTPAYLHFPVVTNAAGQKLSKQTLAPAIGPADACLLIARALAHLGQAEPTGSGEATPAAMLAAAAKTWDPDRIPQRRASHIS